MDTVFHYHVSETNRNWGLLGGFDRVDSCGSVYLFPAGYWLGAEMKYAGIRIKSGPDYYYGWVRLSVAANAESITVLDCAYNSTLNELIIAGDGIPVCAVPAPSGLITYANAARIKWSPMADAESFQVYYRQSGTTPWIKLITPQN